MCFLCVWGGISWRGRRGRSIRPNRAGWADAFSATGRSAATRRASGAAVSRVILALNVKVGVAEDGPSHAMQLSLFVKRIAAATVSLRKRAFSVARKPTQLLCHPGNPGPSAYIWRVVAPYFFLRFLVCRSKAANSVACPSSPCFAIHCSSFSFSCCRTADNSGSSARFFMFHGSC